MNPKTISIENPSELTNAGGRISWNWKINYMVETDEYYSYVLTEPYLNPHPKGIDMKIPKKTKLMYNPQNFIPEHHIDILFEIPYGKWVTKTMSLDKFKYVNAVIICMMDGVNEVNQS
jgi:hypothetical protein